jgi:hypothetical protein
VTLVIAAASVDDCHVDWPFVPQGSVPVVSAWDLAQVLAGNEPPLDDGRVLQLFRWLRDVRRAALHVVERQRQLDQLPRVE